MDNDEILVPVDFDNNGAMLITESFIRSILDIWIERKGTKMLRAYLRAKNMWDVEGMPSTSGGY